MSAHVLLNLSNELGKNRKNLRPVEHLIISINPRVQDSLYHLILKSL